MNTPNASNPQSTPDDDDPTGVAVIGAGLIGASLALSLRERGYGRPIIGTARRPETIDQATALGCFDRVIGDAAEAARSLGERGLVVVCVPLGVFARVFQELQSAESETLTLTDAGSTKCSVVQAARQHLRLPHRFVPAHPMAGSEKSGPAAGRADLFQHKPCIITPQPDNPDDAVAATRWLWQTVGMNLLEMSPDQHDRQSAVVSHLPHAAAVLLTQIARQNGGMDMASTGFRDTTRLASSNPGMRRDIMLANRSALIATLKSLQDAAAGLIDTLEQGDADALLDTLEQAGAFRDGWLKRRDDS